MTFEECLESHEECLVLQSAIMRGECAKGKNDLLLEEFLGNHIIEVMMEVIEVEGGIAVLLSEHPGNGSVLELSTVDGPLVTKPSYVLNTFLTLLLEQYRGGGLVQGVWHQCTVPTGCYLLFLLWG